VVTTLPVIRSLTSQAEIVVTPLGRHRLKDLAEPVEVFQLDPLGRQQRHAPLNSLNATVGFLPQFGSEFLFRSTELEDLTQLLRKQNLVTVVGGGGVGKSRLAVEAGRQCTPWLPDGAHFVDLAEARDAESLPAHIATGMKLRPEASVNAEALVVELTKKEALVILDGCERFQKEMQPLLKRILQGCPLMKCLVTSRSTLKISGEQVFRLLPMATPGNASDIDDIEAAESVRFFVNKAAMTRHDFTLSPKNARAIATICAHLDGVPAALEMAALRVRSLTPEQISARLGNRFRMLGQSGSDNSLQALFDWSWESLGEREQRFAWCSTVFEGSFDLEAAEALIERFETEIAGVSPDPNHPFTSTPIDPYSAVDHIDVLVEKSLLSATERSLSMRYRLTTTFREYVREKWMAPDAIRAVETAHASYFSDRVEGIPAELIPEDASNFSRAIDFYMAAPEPTKAAKMELLLVRHWESAGVYAEGCRRMRKCDELCDPEKDKELRGDLLNGIGLFEYYLGEFDRAKSDLKAASEIATEVGNKDLMSKSLNNLSLVYMAEGKNEEAIESLEKAIPLDRAKRDDSALAIGLSNLGYLLILQGNLERAKALLDEALQVTSRTDDRRIAISCLCNLSDLALEQDDLELSASYSRRGMQYAEELNNLVGSACCQTSLGEVALRRGSYDEAETLLRRALARSVEMNAGWLIGVILDLLAQVFWKSGRLETATLTLAHRQVASTVPSPPRVVHDVEALMAVVQTEVGQDAFEQFRRRAERSGVASLLDELPYVRR
jgi:predicted ATPase/uncharacterized protein HemY